MANSLVGRRGLDCPHQVQECMKREVDGVELSQSDSCVEALKGN